MREEALLVLPVAGEIERLDGRVGHRRQRAAPAASVLAALVPHPQHLAAQPQRHLAQPVPASSSSGTSCGEKLAGAAAGAHGSVTSGLWRAC